MGEKQRCGICGTKFDDDALDRLEFYNDNFPQPIQIKIGTEDKPLRRCPICLPTVYDIANCFRNLISSPIMNKFNWQYIAVIWRSGKKSNRILRYDFEVGYN